MSQQFRTAKTLIHTLVHTLALTLLLSGAAMTNHALASPAPSPTQTPTQTPTPQQTGEITGRVLNPDGHPVSDAVLQIEGTTRGTLSDNEGRFLIRAVPAGSHNLLVRRLGYATSSTPVTVTAGSTVTLNVVLTSQATVLVPTIVSATREMQRRADASATIDVLDGAEIRNSRPAHPADVLNRLAGVHVSVLTGEGHSMAIRQPITTKPMYLYLEDGIPTRPTGFFNHNALYEINVPQSGGIEVLKGPGTALYGSDAIGGVVNVLTRPAPVRPSAEVSMEGGSAGYARLLASGGLTEGHHGVRADLNLTRTDGWRDASAYDRQSGTVRYDYFRSNGLTARTVLTASSVNQSDVPTLSATQFAETPTLNRAPISYRQVTAVRLSSAIEHEGAETLWSLTPYARYDVLDLMPVWQLSYDPQIWDTRNTSLGMLARYRRDFEPLRTRVITGVDLDVSPGSFTAQQAVTAPTGADNVYSSYTVGETHYDYDVTYKSVAPYVHAEFSPMFRMRVDAGLRFDHIGYNYTNNIGTLETGAHRRPASTDVSYDHLSPKLGVTWEFSNAASAFASWRHGFRAPSQGQLFQQNSALNTVGLRPVTVDSYETGVRGQAGQRLVYQLSLYDMIIKNDILTFVTAENTREASNAGQTRHKGVEASVGAALTSQLRMDASWSRSSQRYVRWQPQAAQPASGTTPARAAVDYSGNLIEQAPRDLGSVMVSWTPLALLRDGRVAVEWRYTGSFAEDAANTPGQVYGGHATVNAQLDTRVAGGVSVFARAVNLLDTRYAELAAYDPFQKEQLTPGAPRSVYAGIKWEVGR